MQISEAVDEIIDGFEGDERLDNIFRALEVDYSPKEAPLWKKVAAVLMIGRLGERIPAPVAEAIDNAVVRYSEGKSPEGLSDEALDASLVAGLDLL